MNESLSSAIEQTITSATGEIASIVESRSLSGGSINDARIVTLGDGRKLFVKSNASPPKDMFQVEVDGLNVIAESRAINVPDVIGHGVDCDGTRFLVLQAIEPGRKSKSFSSDFGRQLAEMHESSSSMFGFESDNFLGSTPQPNTWCDDWCQFWRERRLGFQITLANQNGLADRLFNKLGERFLDRLDNLLTVDEPPALIHGDLWSGNLMVDANGEPVLIDPAVYFAQREAEFGMTTLFGGFEKRFFAAYSEVWPLEPGSETRIEIYRLYHLLNHLNLFGVSYRASCLEILKKYS